VEKSGRARQATNDNIIRRMRIASQITKVKDTHSEYVIMFSHGYKGYANVPPSYVERALTLLTCTGPSCESSGLLPVFYLGGSFLMPGKCMWTCGRKATMGQVFYRCTSVFL
jgi:hypothetical protein